MLDCHGKETLGFQLKIGTVSVLGSDTDPFRPLDVLACRRKAQTALTRREGSVLAQDLRIDEYAEIAWFAFGSAVHNENLPVFSYLRCRETNAGGGVHGLGHIVDQAP